MIQLPENIEAGEAIAAIVGVRPFLTTGFERISADQWHEIGRLDKTIHSLARDLVREKLDKTAFPAIDYDQYLDALSKPVDPEQIDNIVEQFPLELHDVTTAYMAQVGKVLRFLRGKFPISTFTTMFGAENLPPADTQVFTFEDVLELVDRPLVVFEMVDAGRITSDLALALMQCFPTVYKQVIGEIVVRSATEKVEQGDDFDPKFGPSIAVLLAVPGVDPDLRTQLQQPTQQQQNQQQQQAQQPLNSNVEAKRLAPKSDQPDLTVAN